MASGARTEGVGGARLATILRRRTCGCRLRGAERVGLLADLARRVVTASA